MFIDVVLIGILILANGFFAAAEMALVTTRRTRLKILAERGNQMAAKALVIQDSPNVNISFDVEISPLDAIRISKNTVYSFLHKDFRTIMYRHILRFPYGEF